MVDILVRNVDDAVAARLKEMAEQRGTSVQQVAHDILTQSARLSRAELVRRLEAHAARMKPQTSDSTDIIRAMRDGDIRG
jgi:plasmid stability protein